MFRSTDDWSGGERPDRELSSRTASQQVSDLQGLALLAIVFGAFATFGAVVFGAAYLAAEGVNAHFELKASQ